MRSWLAQLRDYIRIEKVHLEATGTL
jgi:hypothetical protein